MRLRQEELQKKDLWQASGYLLPEFDRNKMVQKTKMNPEWVHFGGGNIFRAFPAAVCQELLNKGLMDTGIIVAEGYDYEIIENSFRKFDDLSLLVTLKTDGSLEKKVIGSIAESLCIDTGNKEDWNRLSEIFKNPSLKMVSFTITEKGYSLVNAKQEYLSEVSEDFKNKPEQAGSYIGKLTALCYIRYCHGKLPLTLVSMDNCSHNGTRLYEAVTAFADKWVENGIVEKEFADYVRKQISYPWTMIDKITPRPSDSVAEKLKESGFLDTQAVVTVKNTYIAPFVNAEEPEYLVIEDDFKNGRLPLHLGGILYTDRETVDKVEKMKVCTCLNPLHTALAVFGCLLSYHKISEEMKDRELVALIKKIGYEEGLPVVTNPVIINPKDFIDEVINVRLPNTFMPDTPQRIACDTSQKLAIRFGETIKAYQESTSLQAEKLTYIPFVLAGWLRYLIGINDNGEAFDLSPDPRISELVPKLSGLQLGHTPNVHEYVKDILADRTIFGVDLYQAGLGQKVEKYLEELLRGRGAVRQTLIQYLG